MSSIQQNSTANAIYNTPTFNMVRDGSCDPSTFTCLNLCGAKNIVIETTNLPANADFPLVQILIFETSGNPGAAKISCDEGQLILGESTLLVSPGQVIGLVWSGSAFLATN